MPIQVDVLSAVLICGFKACSEQPDNSHYRNVFWSGGRRLVAPSPLRVFHLLRELARPNDPDRLYSGTRRTSRPERPEGGSLRPSSALRLQDCFSLGVLA